MPTVSPKRWSGAAATITDPERRAGGDMRHASAGCSAIRSRPLFLAA